MATLEEQLLEEIKGVSEGFAARLRKLPISWTASDAKVNGHFYYLALRDGQPTLDELVDFLYQQIVHFCIPKERVKKAISESNRTGHARHLQSICDQARNLFIKHANLDPTKKTKAGEPGEILLYVILESVLNAPQIACKMYLKTSENMPVHGSDSVHVGLSEDKSMLILYWGESKLYQKVSTAFDEAIDSIRNFRASDEGRPPRDRDIDIIRDHMSISDPVLKEKLLRYFDPYCEESNELSEAFACFIGFDFAYSFDGEVGDAEERYRVKCSERCKTILDLFQNKLVSTGLEKVKFEVFLVPFIDVDAFRKAFLSRLGAVT